MCTALAAVTVPDPKNPCATSVTTLLSTYLERSVYIQHLRAAPLTLAHACGRLRGWLGKGRFSLQGVSQMARMGRAELWLAMGEGTVARPLDQELGHHRLVHVGSKSIKRLTHNRTVPARKRWTTDAAEDEACRDYVLSLVNHVRHSDGFTVREREGNLDAH